MCKAKRSPKKLSSQGAGLMETLINTLAATLPMKVLVTSKRKGVLEGNIAMLLGGAHIAASQIQVSSPGVYLKKLASSEDR